MVNFMNQLLTIILKGSIAVIYLFLVIKMLGKKQISELNIFDYIIGLSLGNIAAEMTVNKEITIIGGLIGMSVYGAFSLFVSFLSASENAEISPLCCGALFTGYCGTKVCGL